MGKVLCSLFDTVQWVTLHPLFPVFLRQKGGVSVTDDKFREEFTGYYTCDEVRGRV